MPEHAHDHDNDPNPDPPAVAPLRPGTLTLNAHVEREAAAMEAAGRTMAAWLDEIELVPGLERGWATGAIRELREADDPREIE